jgi:hypothetical protein
MEKEFEMRHAIPFIVLTALFAGTAVADDDANRQHDGDRRGPPKVALEACASSVRGDPCSFEGRRGENLEGTCEAPEGKPLACRPADAPPMELRQRQQ